MRGLRLNYSVTLCQEGQWESPRPYRRLMFYPILPRRPSMDIEYEQGNQQTGGCLMAFIDAAVWQTFATYMIPRFAVTGVTRLSREILTPTSHSHTPPLIGLFTILVLSKPIDNTVDLFLDSTLRKL
ncbi:mitochondrial fission process protein 1-like isoform X2 [Hermetia illucens]|uniref:mitochondrial fission process protein 1-like isoform X2 n=1 Tax=Hermetia illucens TaxID=343691 RepID=UPI0018CC6D16|nr:mitochondrial fission process protein 1-like isoform X2 [Hermetia illucens]